MLRRPAMDPESKTFKFKICLVGEEGVGKTSLIHRFVSGAFDESYIRTLGAVVANKTDLAHRREVNSEDASTVLASYECPVLYTSAKTGENVEQAFQGLAKTIVESMSPE